MLALGDEIAVGAEGLEGLTVADEGAADRVVRAPAEAPGAKAAVEGAHLLNGVAVGDPTSRQRSRSKTQRA